MGFNGLFDAVWCSSCYVAGGRSLVQHRGTETGDLHREQRSFQGHESCLGPWKNSCATDPRKRKRGIQGSLRFQNTSPLLLSRGRVENPRDNYKAPRGSNSSDVTVSLEARPVFLDFWSRSVNLGFVHFHFIKKSGTSFIPFRYFFKCILHFYAYSWNWLTFGFQPHRLNPALGLDEDLRHKPALFPRPWDKL